MFIWWWWWWCDFEAYAFIDVDHNWQRKHEQLGRRWILAESVAEGQVQPTWSFVDCFLTLKITHFFFSCYVYKHSHTYMPSHTHKMLDGYREINDDTTSVWLMVASENPVQHAQTFTLFSYLHLTKAISFRRGVNIKLFRGRSCIV